MFCQTCGNAIIDSLKFCNRCGSRINGGAIEKIETPQFIQAPNTKPTSVIVTLSILTGLIVLIGLGLLFPFVLALVGAGVEVPAVAAMVMMFLATIFGISFFLIRQISRAMDFYLHGGNPTQQPVIQQHSTPQPAQLFNRSTAQIEGQHEQFLSVTEGTTRTLDKVIQERNS